MAPNVARPGVNAASSIPSNTVGVRVLPQGAAAGPGVLTQVSPSVLNLIITPAQPPIQDNLPDAGTQNGNLFRDRFNAALYWYLPGYVLADDPDVSFSFSASQTGVDSFGNPFHKACLRLGVKKVVPEDVAGFKTANPATELREIPLHNLAIMLSVTYKDSTTGSDQHTSFAGVVQTHDDNSAILTFDNILGNNVIILYENLKVGGGAQVSVSAAYDVWKWKNTPWIIWRNDMIRSPRILPTRPEGPLPIRTGMPAMGSVLRASALAADVTSDTAVDLTDAAGVRPSDSNDSYERDTPVFTLRLPLDNKYARDGYQLKYTVSSDSVTRPIISINDLKDFDIKQSEFAELAALGDISQKYPSLKKLYIGALSRTIVAIPREYVIVRKASSCAAVCLALVDSSSLGSSSCKFEFQFLLAANISPIELLQLSQEISNNPDCKDYALRLPDTLSNTFPSSLVTPFQTSCEFAGAGNQHIFTLAVEIKDDSLGSPAVANANLFIKQLCLAQEPYLTGTINLKLDDNYAAPVDTNVILNLQVTGGTEGMEYRIDEGAQCINLANTGSFDLLIKRYALCTSQGVTILPLARTVSAGQTLPVPLPADHAGLSVLLEYAPVAKSSISKDEIGYFLQFQTQDVQKTQYQLGINASGVDFGGKGLERIDVQLALTALPDVSVPAFSLYPLHTFNGAQVQIPIQYAISRLDSVLQFTVHYKDSSKPNLQFTKQNDFIDTPIYVLRGEDLAVAH